MNRKINKSVLFTIKQGYLLSVALFVFILFSSLTTSLGIVDIKKPNVCPVGQFMTGIHGKIICAEPNINFTGNVTMSGSTFNETYAKYAYNQSGESTGDGSYNVTYAIWAYNQTGIGIWSYNQTYLGSTFNSTYSIFSYNYTIIPTSTYNTTYASGISYWYNYSSIPQNNYNITYAIWSYNQTGLGIYSYNFSLIPHSTYNSTYALWSYNQSSTSPNGINIFNQDLNTTNNPIFSKLTIANVSSVEAIIDFSPDGGSTISDEIIVDKDGMHLAPSGNKLVSLGNGIGEIGVFNNSGFHIVRGSLFVGLENVSKWFYNMTIGGVGDGSFNSSYAIWAYNQTGIGLAIKDQHTHAIQNITAIPNCGASEVLTNRSGVLTCVTDQTGSSSVKQLYKVNVDSINATGLTPWIEIFNFTLSANKNYSIECLMHHTSNVTTSGIRYNITFPSRPQWATFDMMASTSATAFQTSIVSGSVLSLMPAAVTASLAYPALLPDRLDILIDGNASLSGTATLLFSGELATLRATVGRDSSCSIQEVS